MINPNIIRFGLAGGLIAGVIFLLFGDKKPKADNPKLPEAKEPTPTAATTVNVFGTKEAEKPSKKEPTAAEKKAAKKAAEDAAKDE